MADNEVIFPVGSDRNNLKLKQINKNGTIAEMIQTIDENFRNIAQHGGGPSGMDGLNGQDGVDGTNVEYIYALSDEMEQDVHYPSDSYEKARLFDGAEVMKQATYKGVTWYDHPQPISEEHKNEYVFTRFRRDSDSTTWFYADKPELWAHWGETGKDGDGVEYIFILSKRELSEQEKNNAFITNLSPKQKAIYNIDDFYPGISWFNETNRAKAITALNESGLYESESSFESDWGSQFGLIKDLGTGTGTWSDDPSGTNPVWTFEYVSIRRSNPDEETAKKEWSEFSKPALWSSYNLPSRTFIIYCNYPVGDDPENPAKPDAPRVGQGWWDNLDGNDRLLLNKPDGNPVSDIWTDDNEEDPEDNEYTWMCSGIFKNSGENIYWSKPVRISGKDGKNGEDGTNIQFIYTLSNDEPNYPDPITEKDIAKRLFDEVEEFGESTFEEDTIWYDRAMAISKLQHTEWMWERYKDDPNGDWEYADSPIIWAHWGEDGTDGDGVEYIFSVTMTKVKPNKPEDYETLTENQKKLFQIDDFVPGDVWFNKEKSKTRAKKVLGDAFSESEWENKYGFNELDSWNDEWSDNPQDIGINAPYQWVSIRRTVVDNEETGEKIWGNFEDPVLWNNYGKTTRVFIVYCNVDEGVTPQKPAGGFWNMNPGANEFEFALNSEAKGTKYYYSANGSTPNPDQNINVWKDSNEDVNGKIAWMASGVFVDTVESGTSNNVSWSEPYRITGAEGKPGKDGDNIEFVYARCDIEAQLMYPKKGSKTDEEYYEDLNNFFDNVEQNSPYTYEDTASGNETIWTDNPQGIEPEPGNRVEWMWSRQKKAGTTQWVYNMPKPQIWSRWGEDGTDGDGVEYIFHLESELGYDDNEELWASYWDLTSASDTKKAIYAMDDFYPDDSWFDTNKQAVIDQMTADGKTFVEADWDAAKTAWSLGNWSDNPVGVSAEYKFLYVSIRKSKDGVWQSFSYPQLWTNYTITSFKSFAFTKAKAGVDLSNMEVTGGTYTTPIPSNSTKDGVTYVWTDTPSATGTDVVWMTSATVVEGSSTLTWSSPQKMTDSSSFQVEWCPNDVGNELDDFISRLSNDVFNYGKFLKKFDTEAETKWRAAVKDGYQDWENGGAEVPGLGLDFGDNVTEPCMMATCQLNNGVWSNWKLVRIKGEKGEAGTSISYNGNIKYELYLGENDTYTDQTALAKLNAEKANLSPAPTNGDLLIVYPHDTNNNDIYYGDSNYGGALYMWKYNGSTWDDYNTSSNGEQIGNAYASPNRHLILWDSDSWQDVGPIVGPEGQPGDTYKILVRYATGTPGNRQFVSTDEEQAIAQWIGFVVFPEGEEEVYTNNANHSDWQWSLFKGQDGYGYEYIYKATPTYEAPDVPTTTAEGYTTPDYKPTDWSDEPIEPTLTNRYVWMCQRKWDPAIQRWTDFKGKDGKTPSQNGVARLWQVYANAVKTVTEYFHADSNISPDDNEFLNPNPASQTSYWKGDSASTGWDSTNRYLFNVEVVTYTDDSTDVLVPHFVATYEDGIKEVVDYYILESASGTNNDNDPGENAPYMNGNTPILTGSTPGIDHWVTDALAQKISAEYPVLWNISHKLYEDSTLNHWTDPIVIGVFGAGTNGKDAMYADLDNEMDSVQVDENRKVLSAQNFTTTVRLYDGDTPMKIWDVDISGEAGEDGLTVVRTYYTGGISQGTTRPADGADSIQIEFQLAQNYVMSDLSQKIVITVSPFVGHETISRMVSYTLVGIVNSPVYKIVPSTNVIIGNGENILNYSYTPNTITLSVIKQEGTKSTTYTSHNSSNGFELSYYTSNNPTHNTLNNTFTYSPSGSGLAPGTSITFIVKVDNTIMDSETIPILKQGKDGADGAAGTNGNGYQYKYIRYVNASSDQYGGATSCSITGGASSSNPTFAIGGVTTSATSNAMGADESHMYEYRSERMYNGTNWGNWSTPVTIAKYLSDDYIGGIVLDHTDTITSSVVSNLTSPTGALSNYVSQTAFSSYKSTVTQGMEDIKTDASTKYGEIRQDIANVKFATDPEGYLLVEKTASTVWFKDQSACEEYYDDDNPVKWVLTSYSTSSEYKGSVVPDVNASTEYSQLHNDDKSLWAILLYQRASINSSTALASKYNSLMSSLSNVTIALDTSNTSSVAYTLQVSASWSPARPSLTATSKYGFTAFATVNVTDVEPDEGSTTLYTISGSELSWKVGIMEVSGSTSYCSLAYTQTNSIFDEPLLLTSASYQYNDVTSKIYESNGSYGPSYGLVLTEDNSGYTVVEASRYGMLSAKMKDDKDMFIIPESTSMSIIKGYLQDGTGSGFMEEVDVPYNKDATYYALYHFDNDEVKPEKPIWYTASLPGDNNSINFEYDNLFEYHTKPDPDDYDKTTRSTFAGNTAEVPDLGNYDRGTSGFYQNNQNIEDADYSMYVTSNIDEIIFDFKINGTSGDMLNVYLDYQYTGESKQEILLITNNMNGTDQTVQKSFIPPIKNKNITFWLKFYKYSTQNSTNAKIYYSVKTINRLSSDNMSISPIGTTTDQSCGGEDLILLNNSSSRYTINDEKISIKIGNISKYCGIAAFTISSTQDKQCKIYNNINISPNPFNTSDEPKFRYIILPKKTTYSELSPILSKLYSGMLMSTDQQVFISFLCNELQVDDYKTGTVSSPGTTFFDSGNIDFKDGYYNSSDGKYYYTVLLLYKLNTPGTSYTLTVNCPSWDKPTEWSTLKNTTSRYSDLPVLGNYLVDKFTVKAANKSPYPQKIVSHLYAKTSDNVKTKNINDVKKEDIPYLIPITTEVAGISQTVSDGIACTDIITSVDDKRAVFFAQATEEGSQIFLDANTVGIHSNHFTLDESGITMRGDLYATDENDNITAGVISLDYNIDKYLNEIMQGLNTIIANYIEVDSLDLQLDDNISILEDNYDLTSLDWPDILSAIDGEYNITTSGTFNTFRDLAKFIMSNSADYSSSDIVKFFAGTSTPRVIDDYPSLFDDVEQAPFRVTKSGGLYANKGQIGSLNIDYDGLEYSNDDGKICINSQGIVLTNNIGDCTTISAMHSHIYGTVNSPIAYVVFNGLPSNKKDELKKYHIYDYYSTTDMYNVYCNYNNIALLSISNLNSNYVGFPNSQMFIGRHITIMNRHPLQIMKKEDDSYIYPLRDKINEICGPNSYVHNNTSSAFYLTFENSENCRFFVDDTAEVTYTLSAGHYVEMLGIGIGNQFYGFQILKDTSFTTIPTYKTNSNPACVEKQYFNLNKSNSTWTNISNNITFTPNISTFWSYHYPFKSASVRIKVNLSTKYIKISFPTSNIFTFTSNVPQGTYISVSSTDYIYLGTVNVLKSNKTKTGRSVYLAIECFDADKSLSTKSISYIEFYQPTS